jgi:hypothetical protein
VTVTYRNGKTNCVIISLRSFLVSLYASEDVKESGCYILFSDLLVSYHIRWLTHASYLQLDDEEYDIPPVDCTPTLESILNNSEDCASLSDDEMSNSVVPTAEVSLQLP